MTFNKKYTYTLFDTFLILITLNIVIIIMYFIDPHWEIVVSQLHIYDGTATRFQCLVQSKLMLAFVSLNL